MPDPTSTHLHYLQMTMQQPGNYHNWLMLGWSAQDPRDALEFFQEALVLNPGDPMVQDSIAWARAKIVDPQATVSLHSSGEEAQAIQALLAEAQTGTRTEARPPARAYWRVLASRRMLVWWLAFYLGLITLSEMLTTILPTLELGLVLHGLVLLLLILHSAVVVSRREQRLLLTLAFAPLIRMTSLSIPLGNIPQMYWYMIIGVPLFLAAFLVVRYAGFSRQEIGLTLRRWPLQIALGLLGLGLGYLEYLILRPAPLSPEFSFATMLAPALILLVFTGLLEEYIFRGLMQRAFTSVIGRVEGILYVSFIFAILHLGYRSVLDVLFVFWVAILFSLLTLLTGSILGATLAHGLTNISLFLIFPFLLSPLGARPAGDLTPSPDQSPAPLVSTTPTPFQPVQGHASPFTTPSLVEILPEPPAASPFATPTGTAQGENR